MRLCSEGELRFEGQVFRFVVGFERILYFVT